MTAKLQRELDRLYDTLMAEYGYNKPRAKRFITDLERSVDGNKDVMIINPETETIPGVPAGK